MHQFLQLLILVNQDFQIIPKFLEKGRNFSWYEMIGITEKEVVECGKTVYAAKTRHIISEQSYLSKSYKNLTFFKSEEFNQLPEAIFIREDGSEAFKILQRYLEGGFHQMNFNRYTSFHLQQRYNLFTMNYSRPFSYTVSAMGLQGNVQTLFYIYLVLVSVAALSTAVETIPDIYDRIPNRIRWKWFCL